MTLWDVASGRERVPLRGHTGLVYSVAFSPDGKTLASAGQDGTVRLWDVVSGKERASFQGTTGAIDCVAFSPDGKTLVTSSAGTLDDTGKHHLGAVRLWDATTGKERARLKPSSVSTFVSFSPDGKTLAAADGDSVGIWDVASGKERAILKAGGYYSFWSAALSPDGKLLAAGGPNGVLLWDVPGAPNGPVKNLVSGTRFGYTP